MKRLSLLLLAVLLLPLTTTLAQGQDRYRLTIFVDSAFLRAEPLRTAPPVGSAFEDDPLFAIGRNADGTWFEVARPGNTHAGWISGTLVSWEFAVWELPLTSTAGADGPVPVFDSGLWVFVLGNATLRAEPRVGDNRVGVVPHSVTIPVVARNQDGTWVQVNYNGMVGWISSANTRSSGTVLAAPEGTGLPPLQFNIEIVPPEVQLAQLNRFRAYLTAQRDLAQGLAWYWQGIIRGTILPCDAPNLTAPYPYDINDIRELPELQRFAPRVDGAIAGLNESLAALQPCGVYLPEQLSSAHAKAVNAAIIFGATLDSLESVEEAILP